MSASRYGKASLFSLLLLAKSVSFVNSAAAIEPRFTKIAVTGDEAFGFPGLTVTGAAGNLSNNGKVEFSLSLSGPGVTSGNDTAYYSGALNAPSLLFRQGDAAPGLPAGTILSGSFARDWFSNDGRTVFQNNVSGPGITSANDGVTWVASPGSLTPLLREQAPAPGMPGLTIGAMNVGQDHLFVTDTGKIMHRQAVAGPGVTTANDATIFYGTGPSDLAPVMREGTAPPDAPAGAVINTINSAGTIARGDHLMLQATLVQGTGGVTSANDSGLWMTNSAGGIKLALREGNVVNGLPGLVQPGTQHSASGELTLSSAGTVLNYGAALLNDGIHANSGNDSVAEIGTAEGGFTVIAREGFQAPDLAAGINYGNSLGEGRIGADGNVLLQNSLISSIPGAVTSANDSALFYGPANDLHLMAREGTQAPGFAPGVNFDTWSNSAFAVNDNGLMALLAPVTDGLDYFARALFATDSSTGLLGVVIKTGDFLEVSPGVFREISALDVTLSAHQQTLNNLNQILFNATFTDGSEGLFVAQVPEPTTISMAVVGLAALVAFRRRKTRKAA